MVAASDSSASVAVITLTASKLFCDAMSVGREGVGVGMDVGIFVGAVVGMDVGVGVGDVCTTATVGAVVGVGVGAQVHVGSVGHVVFRQEPLIQARPTAHA